MPTPPTLHYRVVVGRHGSGPLCYELGARDAVTTEPAEVTCAKCCALMGRPSARPRTTHFIYAYGTGSLCRPLVGDTASTTAAPDDVTCDECLALMGRRRSPSRPEGSRAAARESEP